VSAGAADGLVAQIAFTPAAGGAAALTTDGLKIQRVDAAGRQLAPPETVPFVHRWRVAGAPLLRIEADVTGATRVPVAESITLRHGGVATQDRTPAEIAVRPGETVQIGWSAANAASRRCSVNGKIVAAVRIMTLTPTADTILRCETPTSERD
jgi:hypothetical protein